MKDLNTLLYNELYKTGHDINALKAAQNKKPPYVIYTPMPQTFENCAAGVTDLAEVDYQIDTYSVSYAECKAIVVDIMDAIVAAETFKSVFYTLNDTVEDDGKIHRSRLEINLWSN